MSLTLSQISLNGVWSDDLKTSKPASKRYTDAVNKLSNLFNEAAELQSTFALDENHKIAIKKISFSEDPYNTINYVNKFSGKFNPFNSEDLNHFYKEEISPSILPDDHPDYKVPLYLKNSFALSSQELQQKTGGLRSRRSTSGQQFRGNLFQHSMG